MLVQACLNGARKPGYHPALPLDTPSLVREARACLAAGADLLHLHPRDADGAESLSADCLDAALSALRAALPGVPLGISIGEWIENDTDRVLAAIAGWRLLAVNLSEAAAPAVFEALDRRGVGIEAGLAARRRDRGLRAAPDQPVALPTAAARLRYRGMANAAQGGIGRAVAAYRPRGWRPAAGRTRRQRQCRTGRRGVRDAPIAALLTPFGERRTPLPMHTAAPSRSRLIIAVDGPAAAGKGTLARGLAEALDLPYLDTGMLYRAVARHMLDAGRDPQSDAEAAACAVRASDLQCTNLRTPEIDRAASQVAGQAPVRAALLDFQRRFGRERGAVLDGRDIGTVVFPDAPVKFFLTASLARRAERRWLQQGGPPEARERIGRELAARDAADAARAASPLRPAADAIPIDTDRLDAEAVLAEALRVVHQRVQLP